MSIPVDPHELAATAETFGSTVYLLTSDDAGHPRVNQVDVAITDNRVSAVVGRTASRNARARPGVTLLWPPVEDGGFTLLADGLAEVVGEPGPDATLEVAISWAVLHRRGPG